MHKTILFWLCVWILPALCPQNSLAQDVIHQFDTGDGNHVSLRITDRQLVAEIQPKKQEQILMVLETGVENIEVQHVNNDEFPDIVVSLSWKPQHYKSEVFLYCNEESTFKELDRRGYDFINLRPIGEGQFESVAYGLGYNDFTFQSFDSLFLSTEEHFLHLPGIFREYYIRKKYDALGGLTDKYFYNEYEYRTSNIYLTVETGKTALYEQPQFESTPAGQIFKGDVFEVVDAVEGGWLQIAYTGTEGTDTAWTNYAGLTVDKYALATGDTTEQEGINLNFLYPYQDDKFYFSLGLNNNSTEQIPFNYGRIFILLENGEGQRYLYTLYEVDWLDLPPKALDHTYGHDENGRWYVPSVLLDDNLVEWDEELQKYVIYHQDGIFYPEFIPTSIPDGEYSMYAVLYDPLSDIPAIVSNAQPVTLPLPKVPMKQFEPEKFEEEADYYEW